MTHDPLNEREFELVNILGAELGVNQRDLSRHLELSLGATNMLIRRLISKGYIRIRQLNKRKVEYLLTPQGFAEKMRKSVKYTLKTINSIGLIKERIQNIAADLYTQGERNFTVLGKSDFALLIDMVFKEKEYLDSRITYIDELPDQDITGTLLICKEGVDVDGRYTCQVIDLIHELAMDQNFVLSKAAE